MKTVAVKENKSFFSKLIDKIKNSALFSMAFDENYGMVISSEETKTEKQIQGLAQSANISEKELMSIEAEFNKASSNNKALEDTVSKIPSIKKESSNPFKVENEDLNLSDDQIIDSKTLSNERIKDGRDR